jgi:hypothetical protein
MQERLYDEVEKNRELKARNKKLIQEVENYFAYLKEEKNDLKAAEKRYNSLASSKLGRLTLWYWALRDRENKT